MSLTRRSFLVAPVLATIAPPKVAEPTDDPDLLGLLLAVEQAQIALYARATKLPFRGPVADLAGRFGNEEHRHAARLRSLGAKPPKVPAAHFTFKKRDDFLRLAQRLEGLAVGTYNGTIPHLRDVSLYEAVGAIAQVEARHSAAVRVLRKSDPAPRAYDRSFEPDRALHALTTLLSG
jgi:rubrerythrin